MNIVSLKQEKLRIKRRKVYEFLKKYAVLTILVAFFSISGFFYDSGAKAPLLNAQLPEHKILDSGEKKVLIKQDDSGHYIFIGEINGKKVKFLYDTGATSVSVPEHIAAYLELPIGKSVHSKTANGTAISFRTSLNTVKVGNIELKNIRASISKGLEGDEILLGMSFLKEIDIKQNNGVLELGYENHITKLSN